MIIPIKHSEWQLLRYMSRAEAAGQKPFGRELRINPTRFTKDGTFLDKLVERGLIAIAAKPAPVPTDATTTEKNEPAQFRTRYKLTETGRYAAEYGEYDMPYTPRSMPVAGTAAEILVALAERNWSKPVHVKKPTKKRKK